MEPAVASTTKGKAPIWQNGLVGLAALHKPSRAKLQKDIMSLIRGSEGTPAQWAEARAVFQAKSSSTEIAKHRPLVPATHLLFAATRALLMEHRGKMAPRLLNAEGFVAQGNTEDQVVVSTPPQKNAPRGLRSCWCTK